MLSMRIETMVGGLVRQLLKGGREGEVLHFHFDLSMGYHAHVNNGGDSYTARRGLHLLYWLPPERSYITVFSAVTLSPFVKVGDVKEWKHECTHDTCWRDIGVFAQVYFDMAKEINALLVADGHPEVAPAAMSEHNSSPIFGDFFEWLPAKVVTDPTDDRNYRKLITLGDKVK